jgi:hypothetical protein
VRPKARPFASSGTMFSTRFRVTPWSLPSSSVARAAEILSAALARRS